MALKGALVVVAAMLAVAGLAWLLSAGGALPTGPSPLEWDKTACGHCSMHVSARPFAAQLQTRGGEVFAFDDPGCLFLFEAARRPEVHARWFHAAAGEAWRGTETVRFRRVAESPMGFGFQEAAGGPVTYEAARDAVLAAHGAR